VEQLTYWYAVDIRTALARTKTIFGRIEGTTEFVALNHLEKEIRDVYHAKIIRARLHIVDKHTGVVGDPVMMMDNVLENGGLHAKHTVEGEKESSHACEEKEGTTPVHLRGFGQGWGKAVKDDVSVVKFKT
jgi:hypothetical protein